jgi:hypothetical protein
VRYENTFGQRTGWISQDAEKAESVPSKKAMGRINRRGFALFGDLSIPRAQSVITKTGFTLQMKYVTSSGTPAKSHHANPKIRPVIHAHKNTT